jgi:hypothetical protein
MNVPLLLFAVAAILLLMSTAVARARRPNGVRQIHERRSKQGSMRTAFRTGVASSARTAGKALMTASVVVSFLALTSILSARGHLPCGTGTGAEWTPPKLLGTVQGAQFLFATTVPQCAGDLQDVSVVVRNTTANRLRVRFGIEFVSIGNIRERGLDAGGPINPHWMGDEPLQRWSPFKSRAGIQPDPSLLISHVLLTNVTVCVEDTRPVPQESPQASTYQRPCAQQNNTLRGTPACPDGSPDPEFGYTPLMEAARGGEVGRVLHFIACGANVNAKARDGYTALMFAANSGLALTTEALLRAGADINARQDRGLSALDIVKDGSPDMAALLRRYSTR